MNRRDSAKQLEGCTKERETQRRSTEKKKRTNGALNQAEEQVGSRGMQLLL